MKNQNDTSGRPVTREMIQRAFGDIIENMDLDRLEETIAKHMSPLYIQHVDGHTLNYQGFVEHMRAVKGVLKSAKVLFDRIVVEGNSVCSIHRVNAVKNDGSEVTIKVTAHTKFDDQGKIVAVNECTEVLHGAKEDAAIGSMR